MIDSARYRKAPKGGRKLLSPAGSARRRAKGTTTRKETREAFFRVGSVAVAVLLGLVACQGSSRGYEGEARDGASAQDRRAPQARIILESRRAPPRDLLPDESHESYRVHGLAFNSMRVYFATPQRSHATAWPMSDVDAKRVFHRLGGGQERQGRAHPLGMFLLASVAEGRRESPVEVLV